MLSHEGIDQNLRFLIVEVIKQLDKTRQFLGEPREGLVESVLARDDYIDNLKSVIQRSIFAMAAQAAHEGDAGIEQLKAIDVVTANLERIADFCENIIAQVGHVENESLLAAADFGPFFEQVLEGVRRTETAVFDRAVDEALAICRTEHVLDNLYADAFRGVLARLEEGRDAQTWLTLLFIFHYFERMGDSLLNIGEAVLSAAIGERIKIDQFRALEDSLDAAGPGERIEDVELEAIGGSRSGCRIDRVRTKGEAGSSVIFKEGRRAKVLEEKEGIERWQRVMPELVPKIYSFHDRGDTAAILFEYLPGHTFEQILLRGDDDELDRALAVLCRVLRELWTATRVDEPVGGDFLAQLRRRLGDVYAVHPGFDAPAWRLGDLEVPSLESLVETLEKLEHRVCAPFSVFGHGDFNVDNIIYDAASDRLRFIDVHRSRRLDYVQDVSVFLVSNRRLGVFEAPVQRRIERTVLAFHDFAADFAAAAGDTGYGMRLAFGLARSLATSTRFVLDRSLARSMMLRARYLLDRLAAHDGRDPADFVLPREVLVD